MKNNTQIQMGMGSVAAGNFSDIISEIIPRGHTIDKLLSAIETIAGYALGIFIGLAFGAMAGGYVASIHAEDLKHTIDFFDLDQVQQWHDMPWIFARTGAAIGALLGTAVMSIVQAIFFNREVASLYENDITDPTAIAGILGRSARKTRKTMGKLAKKGIIDYQPMPTEALYMLQSLGDTGLEPVTSCV